MTFLHPTELKKRYPILAKKSLGQHFLIHRPILETMAKKILEFHPKTLLEIGPGPAALTQLVAPHVARMILVEKDSQFVPVLQELFAENPSVEIHLQDFLKTDLPSLLSAADAPVFAIGNLPYNVSVAILKHLLDQRHLFARFYLMFQREVADRLVALPDTDAYGSLSLYCQMLTEARIILPIPPSAFDPRPKVDSAVVEIIPLQKPRFEVDLSLFEKIVQSAFGQRRKTLSNALQTGFSGRWDKHRIYHLLDQAGIDPKRRGETLSLKEFARLTEVAKG